MALHSLFFIFAFLPPALLLHCLTPKRLKNASLLVLSLFFYAWGDAAALPVLGVSIIFNYGAGLWLEKIPAPRLKKLFLSAAITANICLLVQYKYLGFLLSIFAGPNVLPAGIDAVARHLPPGISFFTFSAIAYLIDIYRKKNRAEPNIITFGAWLALFQKMLAGPIARYTDMAGDFVDRTVTLKGFADGVQRFILGLGKKILIANTLGKVADEAFRLHGADLDMPTAWLGIVCYSLQIYFDFSGYTDMALGLGSMFGLRLPENFNYPYTAKTIGEFWQRWHMSLSTWFRDYLYIPLGGNRCSRARVCANLMIVFLLCGLWHGASWSFAAWGLYHGLFLVIERMGLARLLSKTWRPLQHFYAVLVIMTGWVFFRAESLAGAGDYLRAMVSFTSGGFDYFHMTFVNRQFLAALAAACLFSAPVWQYLVSIKIRLETNGAKLHARCAYAGYLAAGMIFLFGVFIACAMQLAGDTYSPFIYTRF